MCEFMESRKTEASTYFKRHVGGYDGPPEGTGNKPKKDHGTYKNSAQIPFFVTGSTYLERNMRSCGPSGLRWNRKHEG